MFSYLYICYCLRLFLREARQRSFFLKTALLLLSRSLISDTFPFHDDDDEDEDEDGDEDEDDDDKSDSESSKPSAPADSSSSKKTAAKKTGTKKTGTKKTSTKKSSTKKSSTKTTRPSKATASSTKHSKAKVLTGTPIVSRRVPAAASVGGRGRGGSPSGATPPMMGFAEMYQMQAFENGSYGNLKDPDNYPGGAGI